jgi:outer membrane protein assembly factor BamD (BamD/ComL family)
VKWLLLSSVCALFSVTQVRGDVAGDLYAKGADALAAQDYATAASTLDQFVTNYPASQILDSARLGAGIAYMRLGDFTKAIDRLSKETQSDVRPEFRSSALYYTAVSQLAQAGKTTDQAGRNGIFAQTAATLTTLMDVITASSRPDDKAMMEDVLYNRAFVQFQRQDFNDSEKDLLQLLQQYSASLGRPDYFVLLGNLYANEMNKAIGDMKPGDSKDKIKALAAKALDAFAQVSNDPNALVQANLANMYRADVTYVIAQLDLPDTSGYDKALALYRLVQRKDDMITLQQKRLGDLRAASAQAAAAGGATSIVGNGANRLIDREESRLTDLKNDPDPIIQALIRMAACYNSLKQCDEARTILHRLTHAPLTSDQQQDVDFQTIYSYVLGGQTAKADAALTGYLAKHPNDVQAESISYQMAKSLFDRGDNDGALKQADRSLQDFSKGRYVPDVTALKAQILTNLGRLDEAHKVITDFVSQHPQSPVALQMMLTEAVGQAASGNLKAALASYRQIKDNNAAGPLQAAAAVGYIQMLQSLKRYDEVISEAKAFAAKYPADPAVPGVLVNSGIAMDRKNDPAAVAALQAEAQKYPKDNASPIALFYVVNIYQRDGKAPEMIQAAKDLRQAFPTAYDLIAQAADWVSAVYLKDKKFDLAIAEYQDLGRAPEPQVAAAAHDKMGSIWLAAAKAMGAYQSMQTDEDRNEAQKRLASAEGEFLQILKNFPDQLSAVSDAFQGLIDGMIQRRSWGLLKDSDFEGYLTKLGTNIAAPEMQTRFALAQAGLVFFYKDKDEEKQYPAALDHFKKALDASPGLRLTRQEADQFGELLIAGKDYARAIEVFTALLDQGAPDDQITQADGNYGLGAAYLAQGNVAQAKGYFEKMQSESWHPHVWDAQYGVALAAEQSGDVATAKQIYSNLMRAPQASYTLQAKAMLGYGRLLEKTGHGMKAANQQDIEYATNYYRRVHTLIDGAAPKLSAEGLFLAGQVFEKAGDKAGAKAQYTDLVASYAQTAPDWAAKAQAELARLGP